MHTEDIKLCALNDDSHLPFMSLCVQMSFYYKNVGPIGLGSTLMTSS